MADQLRNGDLWARFPRSARAHASATGRAVRRSLSQTCGIVRIYINASRSLALGNAGSKTLEATLEDRVAGVKVGMSQHTLMSECLEIHGRCPQQKNMDLIVTLGGGTIVDAPKTIADVSTRVPRHRSPVPG